MTLTDYTHGEGRQRVTAVVCLPRKYVVICVSDEWFCVQLLCVIVIVWKEEGDVLHS